MVLPTLYGNITAGSLWNTLHDALGVLASMGSSGANGGGSSGTVAVDTTTAVYNYLTTTLPLNYFGNNLSNVTTAIASNNVTTEVIPITNNVPSDVNTATSYGGATTNTNLYELTSSQSDNNNDNGSHRQMYGLLTFEWLIGVSVGGGVLLIVIIALTAWGIHRCVKKRKREQEVAPMTMYGNEL